jgi:hypothetical protein
MSKFGKQAPVGPGDRITPALRARFDQAFLDNVCKQRPCGCTNGIKNLASILYLRCGTSHDFCLDNWLHKCVFTHFFQLLQAAAVN